MEVENPNSTGGSAKAKSRTVRYALNKNKYLLDPEVEDLERILQSTLNGRLKNQKTNPETNRETNSETRDGSSAKTKRAALENNNRQYLSEGFRDALLLSLALRTGARASELLDLHCEDLNAFDETVFIRGIKGSNDREIPLESGFFKNLIGYSRTTVKDQLLFPIGYHRLRQIWDWHRPVPKKFHSLRHTFAIRLYRKTKDLRLVQVALGHRNITNTMIYADYVYSQQELKKLIL